MYTKCIYGCMRLTFTLIILSRDEIALPDFIMTFLDSSPFLLIPALSSSTRPLNPSSMRIHPLKPLDMQSFQNDV